MGRFFAAALCSLSMLPALASYESALEAFRRGDVAGAEQELRRLARDDHAEAQYSLGMLYSKSGDYARALPWLERAANQGIADAQYFTGLFYARGLGVEANTRFAVMYLERAAAQDHSDAIPLYFQLSGAMNARRPSPRPKGASQVQSTPPPQPLSQGTHQVRITVVRFLRGGLLFSYPGGEDPAYLHLTDVEGIAEGDELDVRIEKDGTWAYETPLGEELSIDAYVRVGAP